MNGRRKKIDERGKGEKTKIGTEKGRKGKKKCSEKETRMRGKKEREKKR